MKSYRKSQFDNLEKKNARKSLFDLSHEIKTQMCFGRYYPVLVEEHLPNDEVYIDAEYRFQFPGMYFPIQQIGTMRADFFYCSMKLLFPGDTTGDGLGYQKTGFTAFMMGENIELPTIDLNINGAGFGGSSNSQLYPGCSYPIENYMGFPMDTTGREDVDKQMSIRASAFPLSMYLFCYDEYYRNPLWEEPVWFPLQAGYDDNFAFFDDVRQVVDGVVMVDWEGTGDGQVIINHAPFFAHYEKDYFTSARPEPQDGASIKIPSIEYIDGVPQPTEIHNVDGTAAFGEVTANADELRVDGNQAYIETGANIIQLRIAQAMQAFRERVMRIGKRWRGYVEGLWGNDPEPNAVDIPQLIGSHFGRIQISETMTTANTEDGQTANYRGNLSFGKNGTGMNYFCQDYGLIMCILNVMPNTGYQQGIHPMWTREVNTDFALDMFAGIGDQEIKRKELLALNVKAIWDDESEPFNETIGYQDRFAEYKTRNNRMFTTNDLYDSFYMGQKLSGVEENYDEITAGRVIVAGSYPTTNGIREADIFNIQPIKSGNSLYTDSTIWAHIYLTYKVKRVLPYFSTPGKMII